MLLGPFGVLQGVLSWIRCTPHPSFSSTKPQKFP
jgi:hypothetical protein